MSKEEKIFGILETILDKTAMAVCILLFLIGCYSIYDSISIYYNAQDKSLLKYKPSMERPEAIKEISDEAVAWLSLDNTEIDYPIMQGVDNSKYLNTDPYGDFSLSGSIFLDYRNSPDFSDQYSLVYGHHMSNGVMFGALDSYTDPDYFNEHTTGNLIVGETSYEIRLFACVDGDANDDRIFDPGQNALTHEHIKNLAVNYKSPDENLNIIGLSTCTEETTGRIIVFGTLRPERGK